MEDGWGGRVTAPCCVSVSSTFVSVSRLGIHKKDNRDIIRTVAIRTVFAVCFIIIVVGKENLLYDNKCIF